MMITETKERATSLFQLAQNLEHAKRLAIKAKLDQSVVSELDHLQGVVVANMEVDE